MFGILAILFGFIIIANGVGFTKFALDLCTAPKKLDKKY
ncbi:hypothetical protein HMPREF1043_0616 [Streptococcus anginosus subsp. whileyi CCUG 39159]|uniref:Uncharacterized protein n=1 Tax=Streptococcus anginosus subsp. whileyi CCUG 39159 TaxID=1095729 RepID=I0SIL4_STRAP|nr:hypothetical protein HMPREF1043_0616 [Streptococcus anginosus subsp. whileyi CCUG 39159]